MPRARSNPSRRPAAKQTLIIETIREQIVAGRLAPGARLPPRRELCGQFGASLVTVHFSLEQLEREGFIQARGTLGTFVVDNPPHLSNHAIVFAMTPTDPGWPRFWTAIANEAVRLQQTRQRICSVWYGIDGHADNEDFQQLVREVQKHRLAGIMFPSMPYLLSNTPLLQIPGLPRIAVMSPTPTMPDIASIEPDQQSFVTKALDYLAGRGRRRIAVVALDGQAPLWNHALTTELPPRGMETRPYWIQFASSNSPQCARNAAHLLMQDKQLERPDGLIIADDNLVEQASAGLLNAGVQVPQQLDVVAHCNFPWPAPAVVPAKRLGYDAQQLVNLCLDQIDRQRSGHAVAILAPLQAVFEDELISDERSSSAGSTGPDR